MSFASLKRRVERGEALVEGRVRQADESQSRLRRKWREAWTPLRIVVAGLATGFITGRSKPEAALKKLGSISGPRTLRLISSVAGLVGSVQAAFATMNAGNGADDAEHAAAQAAGAGQAPPEPGGPATGDPAKTPAGDPPPAEAGPETAARPPRRRADQRWDSQPSPAEAATELSER